MNDLAKKHAGDVQNIQRQMRRFFVEKKPVKIFHGSTNSTRAQEFREDEVVDVSALNRILEVNATAGYVVVEPNVPMDALVAETLKHGCIPPVVMEFPGITVGGGIQGGAEESSSFRYGLFHDCALEYEVVIGNGEILVASRQHNAELFWGIAGSYGSLGIITLVKLQLIPAKQFVRLTYRRVKSFEEMISMLQARVQGNDAFLDGIMFAQNLGAVITGNFEAQRTPPFRTFRKATDQWFYLHAQDLAQTYSEYSECTPLEDYLFRYDRGAFWMGQHGFARLHVPFNRFTRFVLNPICNTRTLYKLLHATNLSQEYFLQDFGLPQERALDFLHYLTNTLGIFPLWLCPLKTGRQAKLAHNYLDTAGVLNIGVWGQGKGNFSDFRERNRALEAYVQQLGGRKMLYAHAYYTREEFWKIYDAAWYTRLRKQFHADLVFPDVYEKTKVVKPYTASLARGLLRLLTARLKLTMKKT